MAAYRLLIVFLSTLALIVAGGVPARAEVVADLRAADTIDPRLSQTVTLKADCARLADFFLDLSQSTGVGMAVGWDNEDWQSYDRKISAQVSSVKLCELMHQMAAMMDFSWSRSTQSGQYVYVLFQSDAQRAEERKLAAAYEASEKTRLSDKRADLLSDLAVLGKMSSADAASLKSSDPWRYVLATESLGRGLSSFFDSSAEARQAYLDGGETTIPVASMLPQLQDTLKSVVGSYGELTKSIGGDATYTELLSGQFDRLQLTVNGRSMTGVDIVSRSVLGRLAIWGGSKRMEIPLFDPSTLLAKTLGNAIISLRSGQPAKRVAAEVETGTKAAIRQMNAADDVGVDITSNPALRQSLTIIEKDRSIPLSEVLDAISSNTGLNVLSDCYGLINGPVLGGARTLGAHLLDVRRVFGKDWQFADGLLVLRDHAWFVKRSWEVPQVWMEYWTDRGERNRGLKLEDLVGMAGLRDAQLENTIAKDAKLVGLGAGDAVRNRDILRFYGALSKDQQAALETGRLSVSGLTDEQWGHLKRALTSKGAAYAALEKKSQHVRMEQSGSEIVQHLFRVYPDEDNHPVEFKVVTGFTTDATYRVKPQ